MLQRGGNIGYASGSTGTVAVSGAGPPGPTAADLYIGRNGTGTLNIGGGGAVSNVVGRVGGCDACIAGGVGTVTVSGVGATWTNSTGLAIGDSGTGQVTISGGGQVLTGSAGGFLGNGAGSAGTMTVTGSGSAWTSAGNIKVGNAGTGALTVGDGGAVNVAGGTGTIVVAAQPGSIGNVNIGALLWATRRPHPARSMRRPCSSVPARARSPSTIRDPVTLFANDTGTGAVNVLAGTTILTGANTYTGATTIRPAAWS